ncbi:MAG TPA: hypothetical protein VNA16_08170, partial [Abditibacteriaceae bacterium]|nr:hypothetical protein [Abditibacteriaceae bacterium]
GEDDVDRILMAATDAFAQAVAQLLAPADDTITLPRVAAPTPGTKKPVRPAPVVSPIPPKVEPVPPLVAPPTVTLPGGAPIAGSSSHGSTSVPQLPAPTPPLGISVPDAPSVAP